MEADMFVPIWHVEPIAGNQPCSVSNGDFCEKKSFVRGSDNVLPLAAVRPQRAVIAALMSGTKPMPVRRSSDETRQSMSTSLPLQQGGTDDAYVLARDAKFLRKLVFPGIA